MITLRDVNYTYPNGVEALKNITLELEGREFVALMGENGSGKTTLLKHFNGLLRPTGGSVIVDGQDTRKSTVASLSRKIGIVFQNPDRYFFSDTVEDEIAFGLRNFGFPADVIRRQTEWALKFMDLERYRKQSPHLLSGGEKKRLALASVLAWDPEVLVLDEPTIGQDYGQKEKLSHLITQLNAQGRSVIIATHDVEFVAAVRPRVILMSKARVRADGSAEEVLTDIKTLQDCSIIPPQITQLMNLISHLGFSSRILDLTEAVKVISERI